MAEVPPEYKRAHESASNNFILLNLSYRFTVAFLKDETLAAGRPVFRFLFSKPTARKPEPEIVVSMVMHVVNEVNGVWTFALYFEGQKYERVITMDSAHITGDEFNERLIDKVFQQKEIVRTHKRWLPDEDEEVVAK